MASHITVDTLQTAYGIDRWKAVAILKKVASSGVGVFKCGRKGWPSRLESK
jgi:hypothetical protein